MATVMTRRAARDLAGGATPADLGNARPGGRAHLRLVHSTGSGRCDSGLTATRRRIYPPVLRQAPVVPVEVRPAPRKAARPTPARRPRLHRPRSNAALRITRRGRLCLTLLAVSGAVWLFASVAAPAVAGLVTAVQMPTATAVQTEQVTVLPGQTLWEIAEQARPSADPRDVVVDIKRLNDLPDSRVMAGQRLLLPAH